MRRPTFVNGVVVAAGLAVMAAAVVVTLGLYLGAGTVVRIVVPLVAFGYLLYLLQGTRDNTGKLTTLCAWSVLSVAAWILQPALPLYVIVHTAAIWLVRSLYFYAGVVPALLDLGLCLVGIASFTWALSRTGSVFLATWCFFLVQALFTTIPASIQAGSRERTRAAVGRFERARRQADEALRQLINNS
jgi:hypothetical protein